MRRNSTRQWKYQTGLNLAAQRGYATDLDGRYGDVACEWYHRCRKEQRPFVLVSIQTTYATVEYDARPFTDSRPGLDWFTPATGAEIDTRSALAVQRSPNKRAKAQCIEATGGEVSGLTIRDAHDLAAWLARQLRDVTRYRPKGALFAVPAGADDPFGGDAS